RKLARFNIKLACVDFSKEMMKEAKRRVGRRKNVRFVNSDLRKMPFKSGSFDLAILSNVLINQDDKSADNIIKEISRILKKSGLFLLNFENLLSFSQSYMILASYKNYRQGKLFARTYLSGKIMKMLKRNGFHVDKIVPVRYERLSPIMKKEPLGRKAARVTASRKAFVSSLRYFLGKILIRADAIFRANAAYIIVAKKEGR
ncbi:MAG: class I SAM-dependent methyltransferase, partial [Candidatus Woesearchaeota archaeon]|nr:class I SAM-dependent methyltransferase [Candidatus Woesearchaeota archaeon]